VFRKTRGVWLGVVLALLSSARRASAEAGAPSFSVEFDAPPECPPRAAFVAAVSQRARGGREQNEGAEFRFRVELSHVGALLRGTLVIGSGEHEFRREIPEASCESVLDSMAVIASMVLEGGRAEPPEPPLPPAPGPRAPEAPPEPAPAAASKGFPVRFGGALGAGVQTGVAPRPSLSLAVGIDALARGAPRGPSVRAYGEYAESGTERTSTGTAHFRLWAVELLGCSGRLPAAEVGLRVCLALEAGDLAGTGTAKLESRTQHMLWVGAGAALRFEAALNGTTALELEAKALRLLRTDVFVFDPNDVRIHEVPEWTLGLRAGPVFRLP
jgi:hypothetical protein